MWFTGLVVGALLGSSFGHNGWAVGGIFGALAGVFLREYTSRNRTKELQATLEAALRELRARIETLEERAGIPKQAAPAAKPTAAEPKAATAQAAKPEAEKPTAAQPAAMPRPAEQPVPVPPEAPAKQETPAFILETQDMGGQPAPEPSKEPEAPAPSSAAEWERDPVGFVLRWIKGGNPLARTGLFILFLGLCFFAKYAADHGFLPIELRLAGIAACGLILLAIGWRLRSRRRDYALALQGGGVGVLYLSIFAAIRLYGIIPPSLAFILFFLVAVLAAALAVLQNSQPLAFIGTAAGFATPILASTGEGSHIQLFAFYALLNLGILGIAWRKSWRLLNLTGMTFTFLLGLIWGAQYYRPEYFSSTEPFLAGFFLLYLAVAVLHSWNSPLKISKDSVDGVLVFLPPLAVFGLQSALVRGMEYGLAYSALIMGTVYVLLAWTLFTRKRESLRLLVECFLSLGIGFLSLAIPLGLDGEWSSAGWAMEGLALFWIGVRQKRQLSLAGGLFLQFCAGYLYITARVPLAPPMAPFIAPGLLSMLLIAAAGLCTAGIAHHMPREKGTLVAETATAMEILAFAWGACWWLAAGYREIPFLVSGLDIQAAWLLFLTITALLTAATGHKLDWKLLARTALILLPGMTALLSWQISMGLSVSAHLGWLAWPMVLAVHVFCLWQEDHSKAPPAPETLLALWHLVGYWLVTLALGWELRLQLRQWLAHNSAWDMLAWVAAPCAALGLLSALAGTSRWPIARRRMVYVRSAGLPMAAAMLFWAFLVGLGNPGNAAPLPFLPLLNPLDLALTCVLLVVAKWCLTLRRHGLGLQQPEALKPAVILLGVVAFACLNGAFLRCVHHYGDVPYKFLPLIQSGLAQTGLSILWGLLGLTSILTATRRVSRSLWLTGCTLMILVVIKLFLLDLSGRGTVERIISFVVTGVLLLAVGYYSPLPPKKREAQQ